MAKRGHQPQPMAAPHPPALPQGIGSAVQPAPFTRTERLAALDACLPFTGACPTFDARLDEAERLAGLLLARVR